MRIAFRTDASTEIGTGHVMRCLTLANALREQGAECHFICREHQGNLISFLIEQGHRVHALPDSRILQNNGADNTQHEVAHTIWLGASQEVDARLCQVIAKELRPDWLIVDHYALDAQWEKALRSHCKNLMVIDDLVDRQHDCDLLLDQTFGRTPKDYLQQVPKHCQLLCGTEYALLRPEFSQWRNYSLKRRTQGQLEQLLINLGGVDKDNITSQILQALADSSLPNNCHITVVMGATAPWIEEVKQQATQLPWSTQVKVGINNMAELMANSDLAIGAAGSTSWERCSLGLPTLMIVLAENQINIASTLKQRGAAEILPKIKNLKGCLSTTSRQPQYLIKMSIQAAKVTDSHGCARVCDTLLRTTT